MKYRPLFFALSTTVAIVSPTLADKTNTTTQAVSPASIDGLLDQAKVIASAKECTPVLFPDAKTVLVSEHILNEYQTDGTYVSYDDQYIKVLTEEGRRGALEQSFSYNQFYGKLEILAVEVIRADGSIVKHDPKAISKEQVDRSQMSMNIYDPNDKVINAAVPDVVIGDTIRFFVKRAESKARMKGSYSDWSVLESSMPIKLVTYEYLAPKEKPLVSKALLSEIKGTVQATETIEGDKIRYKWIASNVPQAFPEAEMPSLSRVGQRLIVSTLSDWKEVSRWYSDLCKPHLSKSTPAMKAKTLELVSQCKTEDEKIKTIFTFVSQEIRYMGITTETDAPGYEPHDVNITFENRYGVCRDKAALLATMLEEAGIPAFPVLIMQGDLLDKEIPCPFFNHAITAARKKDGTYVLMDSTNEHTADLLPQYLYHKSYLVATPEGETLMTSPVSPASDSMATAKTTVRLSDDGSATATTVLDLKGINDVMYRSSFATAKPDQIQRSFEGSLKKTIAGATLHDYKLEPTNMQNTDQTIRLTLNWSAPNLLVAGGEAAQLELPFAGYQYGITMRIIEGSLDLDKRRYPLKTDYTCGVHEDLEIILPPSLDKPLSLPQYENTKHKDFSMTQAISVEGNVLKASFDARLESPEISPQDYLILKQAVAKVQINGRQQPVFSRKADALAMPKASADVEVLSSRYSLRMENASTWSSRHEVKKKVLTYGGKKSNSELKLDYNPIWETVEIEYAQVTQKDGTVRKIKAEEMNTLDASWVASAPRYPGEKTLVVSLPGVEVGALIEYAIKRTTKDQLMFHASHAFVSSDIVKETEFLYDLPASLNPHVVVDLPEGKHMTDTTKDGRRHLTFRWENLEPQISESSTPPSWVDEPDFAISSGSWPTYAKTIGARVMPLTDKQSLSEAKAKALCAAHAKPLDQITAIRNFVAEQIRRAAPNFTQFPLDRAFTAADTTLKEGYGHGADRSILLYTLLKNAGFDTELALASGGVNEPTLRKRSMELPNIGYFSALICRVKHPERDEWLPMDLINQYAPLGATYLDEQPGYSLDGKPFTWSAPADRDNIDEDHLAMDFDDQGTATITMTRKFHGASHAGFVAGFSEMSPEERRRAHQSMVSSISQNAIPAGDLVTDMKYPGTLSFTVKVERYGIKNNKGLYFDLPAIPDQFVSARSNQRQRPLLITDQSQSTTTWKVTAPGGLKPIIQPAELVWTGPGNFGTIAFHTDAEQADGKTSLTYTLKQDTKPVIIPQGNYQDLLDLNRHFSHPSARRVLLDQ